MSRKKAGNLVSDKIDLSRHVEIDLAVSFRQIKKSGTQAIFKECVSGGESNTKRQEHETPKGSEEPSGKD